MSIIKPLLCPYEQLVMLESVKKCYKRTGLAETVLVISSSVCTSSTVSIGTLQGLQESVSYPEFQCLY